MAFRLHPHVAARPPTGWVRVDLHSHTMWSGDSSTTADEVARAVTAAGIDVLCITDHNTVDGARQLASRLPCRVIVGEEVRTAGGELIGLFLDERVPRGIPAGEAARRIRAQNGLVYVPHPFDATRHCLRPTDLADLVAAGLVDVVEVLNAKTSTPELNERAAAFAHEHGLAPGAASDAHVPDAFGAAYVEVPDFDGPAALLGALRHGRLVGHHFDAARPWEAHVVPSTRTSATRGR